jgi:hypothetical protein
MPSNNVTQGFVSGSRTGRRGVRGPQIDSGIYKLLFRVVFRHAYNNDAKRLCPGFTVMPSPTSADLMRAQGMVFHDDGSGFSVYIRESQIADLVSYLKRQARGTPADVEYWSWLSFILVSQDPFFVGISKLPIDTNPLYDNLYGTNRDAHQAHRVTLLAEDAAMDGKDTRPVTPGQFSVPVPFPYYQAVVQDISGRDVLVTPSDEAWQEIVREFDTALKIDDQPYYVQVDLSTLPLGLYKLFVRSGPGEPNEPYWKSPEIYTAARPGPPLVFLDMLFTQPYRSATGVYPVPPLFESGSIEPADVGDVTYELRFGARETWWQYYIVSQTPGSTLLDLKIFGDGVTFTRAGAPVRLPNGERAQLFQSDKTLGLREIPPQRFALTGLRRDKHGKLSPIRVDPLPAAPVAPVWPAAQSSDVADRLAGTSEMYVYV